MLADGVTLAGLPRICWLRRSMPRTQEAISSPLRRDWLEEVQQEVDAQLKELPPNNPAHASPSERPAQSCWPDQWNESIAFVNRFAPEHLSLAGEDCQSCWRKFDSAGTIFLGPLSAQPFGDYASGSNHVLPTGGWARRRGGLSASDFVKRISVQTIEPRGFRRLAGDVQTLARAEGLTAHANAVEVRR